MSLKTCLSASIVAAVISLASASSASAAVKLIDFTLTGGSWNHLNGVDGPYGLSLQPTVTGRVSIDDTKADASGFVGLNYTTGTRVWTLADIQSNSQIFYSGGVFENFVLNLGTGNVIGTNNSAVIAEGPNTLYCNGCVSVRSVSGVPEPSTWALLILGFGMAGATLRQRISVAA